LAFTTVSTDGVAEASLDQPGASAGHVSRGKGNRLAERVEGLLDTFAKRRFVLGLARLLAA
jgi:hypothetical protein